MVARLSVLAGLMLAVPAAAQERDLCTDRPGLGTPACTVEPGRVVIEAGVADWTREHDATTRTDTLTDADLLLRVGIAEHAEVQLGWTPLGHERERDADRQVTHATRAGDVTLGFKANLEHPDGSGVAVALLPMVSLPVGRRPIGAGTWGAGLRVPVSIQLADTVYLDLTPEADAAVDEAGGGRHLAYGSAGGVQMGLGRTVTLSLEGQVMRDRDPEGHETIALASTALTWQPRDGLQLDIGAARGLNHASPDVEVYVGVSRRF